MSTQPPAVGLRVGDGRNFSDTRGARAFKFRMDFGQSVCGLEVRYAKDDCGGVYTDDGEKSKLFTINWNQRSREAVTMLRLNPISNVQGVSE